ncbi:RNA polymerase sigma factor [Cellulomonas cellasea]|uniref:RNA polymerase sigma factor n=1 Tax=Cellulomonas cellasea TaxID=43670 RepID=UPI0009FBCDEB|nr:sigma-70 family RNA polymerase sigma factor [Cellulomonas cellasea]
MGGVTDVDAALTSAFSAEWGRVVATLIRLTGDFALAEDAAQDAFVAAAKRWPVDGVPDRPGAWLTTTARNGALDRLRRATTEARKLREVAAMEALELHGHVAEDPADGTGSAVTDDRLRLIFTCCHPALPLESRVALTLRTLCGLTVPEIARAFGVGEAAMTKRLVRARQKIAQAGIPYRVPADDVLPERLDGVLAVLYLLFTEGYSATAGPGVVREDLSAEAIRLTRVLAELVPDDAEVHGLLALELAHDARRAARTDAAGELVPLEEQDRARWDAGQAADAAAVLHRARTLTAEPGPYLLQAEVAVRHATAATPEATDWAAIAAVYARLARRAPSPYVELSRAVAVAMAHGVDAGLALLDQLGASGGLDGNHYLPAARADLLRRAGRHPESAEAYRAALTRVTNDAERRYLRRRLAEVS